jgi:hypothetical protein
MPRSGKSPPRKGKKSGLIWVPVATAALAAAATIGTAAVSAGNHVASVAPQPPVCVVIQGP